MRQNNILQVFYDDRQVGTLVLNADHKVAFEYMDTWLEEGFSISPFHLPLKRQVFVPVKNYFDGLFGVFADSLPDAWGRLLLDRMLQKNEQDRDTLTVLDRLAIVGESGMGALTYRPQREMKYDIEPDNLDILAEQCRKILNTEYSEKLDELYALGWYGNCGWHGFLSDKELCGFRVRKGNILIGDSKTMNGIFREARFNGWTQGEIFILTDKLIPNARRDDFEQNDAYRELIKSLSETVGLDIARKIREASATRNDPSSKVIKEVDKTVLSAVAVMNEGFNSSVDKEQVVQQLVEASKRLEKTAVKPEFKEAKEDLQKKIEDTINEVSESKNYKINQINSAVDKKSKQILRIVTDILSKKLSKFLVDEILEEIIAAINGK